MPWREEHLLASVLAQAARVMGFSEDKIEQFNDVDEALTVLGPVLKQGDVLLAKASRSAQLDIFVKGVTKRHKHLVCWVNSLKKHYLVTPFTKISS